MDEDKAVDRRIARKQRGLLGCEVEIPLRKLAISAPIRTFTNKRGAAVQKRDDLCARFLGHKKISQVSDRFSGSLPQQFLSQFVRPERRSFDLQKRLITGWRALDHLQPGTGLESQRLQLPGIYVQTGFLAKDVPNG